MTSSSKRTWLKIGTIGIAFMCVFLCGMMYISFSPRHPEDVPFLQGFRPVGLSGGVAA